MMYHWNCFVIIFLACDTLVGMHSAFHSEKHQAQRGDRQTNTKTFRKYILEWFLIVVIQRNNKSNKNIVYTNSSDGKIFKFIKANSTGKLFSASVSLICEFSMPPYKRSSMSINPTDIYLLLPQLLTFSCPLSSLVFYSLVKCSLDYSG